MLSIFSKELIEISTDGRLVEYMIVSPNNMQCTTTESELLTRYLRVDVKCRKQILLNKIISILF